MRATEPHDLRDRLFGPAGVADPDGSTSHQAIYHRPPGQPGGSPEAVQRFAYRTTTGSVHPLADAEPRRLVARAEAGRQFV